jgi:ankyrin repeat protein
MRGNNPLLVANRRDNRDTFAALLDAGADPDVLPRGSTQYNVAFAIIEDLDDDFGRLIHEAASNDDPRYLRMLIDRGADANAKGPWSPMDGRWGITALHACIGDREGERLRML